MDIYEKIGRGMYSEVFKGRKKKTIEYYAIKSVALSQKRRVHQEVKTIHGLEHANILRFYNWYETHNHLWLILEYCVGGDLKSLLQKDMCLPESSVHDFGRDLLAAMQHLHSKGIIHCDLKPTNILLDENGTIKLGGFGCARKLEDINEKPLGDVPTTSRGTPVYMAPELFQEGATQSTASDFWALGCILYESYTGRPPFVNPSFNELVRSILHAEPTTPKSASPAFSDLLKRLLDKNPATRMSWLEMLTHPFWRFSLRPMQMPQEPALQRFIELHRLAPRLGENVASEREEQNKVQERARMVRESVDITRLSQIVKRNLHAGQENARAASGDVSLASADAEVDFIPPDAATPEKAALEHASSAADEIGLSPMIKHGAPGLFEEGPDQGAPSSSIPAVHGPTAPAAAAAPPTADPVQRPNTNPGPGGAVVVADGSRKQVASRPATAAAGGGGPHSGHIQPLLFHRLDLVVRPLVGNKRIEAWSDTKFSAEQLPPEVATWTRDRLSRVQSAQDPAFVTFVQSIAGTLLGRGPPAVKVNLLAFLETLAVSSDASGLLINSALTPALVQLFGYTSGGSAMRSRCATVLGIMIRYATVIDTEAIVPAVDTLRAGLHDEHDRVRRRSMVTLGELIFYLCSVDCAPGGGGSVPQARDVGAADATVDAVLRLLRPSEDQIAQHYACKTIDNVLAKTGFWPERFAVMGTARALLELLASTEVDQVQAAACSALGRIMRFRPSLISAVAVNGGQTLRKILEIHDPRLQVHTLNALNIILYHANPSDLSSMKFLQDKQLLTHVLAMLSAGDRTFVRAQPKALLTTALLLRLGPSWLTAAVGGHMLSHLAQPAASAPPLGAAVGNGTDAELEEYCSNCRTALAAAITATTPALLEAIREAIDGNDADTAADLMPALAQLVTAPELRSRLPARTVLGEAGGYVRALWAAPGAGVDSHMGRASELLSAVLEALVEPEDLLLGQGTAFVELLLPALCDVTHAALDENGAGDMRINATRLLTELLMVYLSRPELYHAGSFGGGFGGSGGSEGASGDVTAALDSLLHTRAVPLLHRMMMSGCDPMPLYAQKVIASLLLRNINYVEVIVQHPDMVHRFFEFLNIESPNNNIHNIRVCRILVATGGVSSRTLSDLQIPSKVARVLTYAYENNVQAFLEPTAELCLALLERDAGDPAHQDPLRPPGSAPPGASSADLVATTQPHVVFCSHGQTPLAFLGSECLRLLSQMFVLDCAQELLTGEGLTLLMDALRGSATRAAADTTDTPAEILQSLLHALAACGANGRSTAPPHVISDLHEVVSSLQGHGDEAVRAAANAVCEMFE